MTKTNLLRLVLLLAVTTSSCIAPVKGQLSLRRRVEGSTEIEPHDKRIFYRIIDSDGESRVLRKKPKEYCCTCEADCGTDKYCQCRCFCDTSSEESKDSKDNDTKTSKSLDKSGGKDKSSKKGSKTSKGDDDDSGSKGSKGDDDDDSSSKSKGSKGDDDESSPDSKGSKGDDDDDGTTLDSKASKGDDDEDTSDDDDDDDNGGDADDDDDESEQEPSKDSDNDSNGNKTPTKSPTKDDDYDDKPPAPTKSPTKDASAPSKQPSPTKSPTKETPTKYPTKETPTKSPTKDDDYDDKPPVPTKSPTKDASAPSKQPSPTKSPTKEDLKPTTQPSKKPSQQEPSNCSGDGACEDSHFESLGDDSCIGDGACADSKDLDIGDGSCQGDNACVGAQESEIGNGSCICNSVEECRGGGACVGIVNSVIGTDSCQGRSACARLQSVVIGNGSCNCDDCCKDLPSGCIIADGECNNEAQGCSDTCPTLGGGAASSKCQSFETNDASLSDGSMSTIADNFIPESNGSVSEIKFYGAYVASGRPIVGSVTPIDTFQVTYYEDDGNGLPGRVIGGPFIQDDEDEPLLVTGPVETEIVVAEAATMYQYKATHAPVPVKADTQYWLEIINSSVNDESQWFWVPSLDGDLMAVIDGPPLNGYDSGDVKQGHDFAFCLNIPFSATSDRRLGHDEEIGMDNPLSIHLEA